MLNVILVKTGTAYKADYANKMLSMLSRHLGMEHKVYCVTDTPSGLDPEIEAITPPEAFRSWWDKLYVFSDLMPEGPLLYLDLDQIIVGDITEIVQECLNHPFSCYSDHISWLGVKLGTAFMTFEAHSLLDVFRNFWGQRHHVMRAFENGGDQVYLGGILNDIYYLDDDFPDAVKSYKFDYLKQGLHSDCKILNCHGRPKPHDITDPLLLEHWR